MGNIFGQKLKANYDGKTIYTELLHGANFSYSHRVPVRSRFLIYSNVKFEKELKYTTTRFSTLFEYYLIHDTIRDIWILTEAESIDFTKNNFFVIFYTKGKDHFLMLDPDKSEERITIFLDNLNEFIKAEGRDIRKQSIETSVNKLTDSACPGALSNAPPLPPPPYDIVNN